MYREEYMQFKERDMPICSRFQPKQQAVCMAQGALPHAPGGH